MASFELVMALLVVVPIKETGAKADAMPIIRKVLSSEFHIVIVINDVLNSYHTNSKIVSRDPENGKGFLFD